MAIRPDTFAERSLPDRIKLQEIINSGKTEAEGMLILFPHDSNRSRRLKMWKDRGLFPIKDKINNTDYDIDHTDSKTKVNRGERRASRNDIEVIEKSESISEETGSAPEEEIKIVGFIKDIENTENNDSINEEIKGEYLEEVQTVSSSNDISILEKTPLPEPILADGHEIRSAVTIPGEFTKDDLLPVVRSIVGEVMQTKLQGLSAEFAVNDTIKRGGPGRGGLPGGKTHVKINATVPKELNDALDALGGVKSRHISAALRFYLELRHGFAFGSEEG